MPKQKLDISGPIAKNEHPGRSFHNAEDMARLQEKTILNKMIEDTVAKIVQRELQETKAELRKVSQALQRAYPEETRAYYDSVGCNNDDYRQIHHYENWGVLGGVTTPTPSYKKIHVGKNTFMPPLKEVNTPPVKPPGKKKKVPVE